MQDPFFAYDSFALEIARKQQSLASSCEGLFGALNGILPSRWSPTERERVHSLYQTLTAAPVAGPYQGYLSHPVRVTASFVNHRPDASYDDVALALCHNAIEVGLLPYLQASADPLSAAVCGRIEVLTIDRGREQQLDYRKQFYDRVEAAPDLLLLKALDKLDNTFLWIDLTLAEYHVTVVTDEVCPRLHATEPKLSAYLRALVDYVRDPANRPGAHRHGSPK